MRVLVVGPASWNLLLHVRTLPEPRPQSLVADRSVETVGGTSAGKALNLAALGHEVHLHTLLGEDAAGEQVRTALARAGVRLHADPSLSGTEQHVNLMARDGSRLSVYRSVASPAPDLDLSPVVELARSCDAVVLDLADHARRLIAPLATATVAFWTDLHDWDGADAYHLDFAAAADTIVLSADALPDPAPLCRRLAAGGRLVVCTAGVRGATAYAGEAVHQVTAVPTDGLVDSNGAGDAFFSGLLHGLSLGWPLSRALRAGAVAGSTAVQTDTLASAELTADLLATRSG